MQQLSNEEAMKRYNQVEPVLERHLQEKIFVPDKVLPFPRLDCGLTVVNHILGGGIPKGRLNECFGPESVGKSTFAAQCAAQHQQVDENNRVLYLDYEHTMTIEYLQALGVLTNKPRFAMSQPPTIEHGFLLAKVLVQQGLVNLVIWDTVSASRPAAEMTPLSDKELREGFREAERGKSDTGAIGLHARVFSHGIGTIVRLFNQQQATAIFVNQIRTQIDTWGASETTSGGRALKFYAASRTRLSKVQTVKESIGDDFLGKKEATPTENLVRFHIYKNKTAPPFRKAEVRLAYGRGFLETETLLDLAVRRRIIPKPAAGNYELPSGTKLRGTQAVLDLLKKEPKELTALKSALGDATTGDDDAYEEVNPHADSPDETPNDEVSEDLPEGKVAV